MVVDVTNQILGRTHGYRSSECHSLVLSDPNLRVTLQYNCRYRLNEISGLNRQGKLNGIPVEWCTNYPSWWSAWMSYLNTWRDYVVVMGTKVYSTLNLQQLSTGDEHAKLIQRELTKSVKSTPLIWKAIRQKVEGDDGERRNYTVDLCELIDESVREAQASRSKAHIDIKSGKRKYVSPTGQTKMYSPGSEPSGWKLSPLRGNRSRKRSEPE